MIGFKTSRVVVVDDVFDEARFVIEAFGRHGIAVAYCTGQPGELPPEPIEGARLLVLDLYLTQGGDTHAQLNSTVRQLSKIVDVSDRGIGILIWTKHEEDRSTFRSLLSERLPDFKPMFLLDQPKQKYVGGECEIETLVKELDEKLNSVSSHVVMRAWEQASHNAATSASKLLYTCSDDTPGIEHAIGALVRASGMLNQPSDATARFFSGMNIIVNDALTSGFPDACLTDEVVADLVKWTESPEKLPQKTRGSINGAILTDQSLSIGQRVMLQPGDVYVTDWAAGEVRPYPSLSFRPTVILSKSCTGYTDTKNNLQEATEKCDALPADAPERKMNAAKKSVVKCQDKIAAIENYAESSKYCLIEMTPACDSANGKVARARFVAGMLIPLDFEKYFSLSKNPYLRSVGPLKINGLPSETWMLILNSKLVYSRDWPRNKNVAPLLRLREQVITDLQHWLAGHASRPGYYYL